MTILHFPPALTAPLQRLAQFVQMVDAFERDEIEIAVALLIERLDAQDGDPDLEDDDSDRCEAGDDGCAPVITQYGHYWGAAQEGDSDSGIFPIYGVDQSAAPLNAWGRQ